MERHHCNLLFKEATKKIIELLISNGAQVNALSVHGTPLDDAIQRKEIEIVDLLRKYGGKTSEELKAAGY